MKACRVCGTANPPDVAFCLNCGTAFAETCRVCGASRIEGARFCGRCGTPFPSAVETVQSVEATEAGGSTQPAGSPGGLVEAPGSQPDAIRVATIDTDATTADHEVERRLVSVLFADIVGFTPYSEHRDAEEVRATLGQYFDTARAAIERHGGTIEKFIGDAVMAVWGAPTAHEDDAERAVRAALELVDGVAGLSLTARAGVLTGEAAVSVGVVGEGMVVGDTVNTAARLQAAAEPGTVLVGDATRRATSRAISFEPAGQLTLKGKGEPVRGWRALRVVGERGGRNREETLEPPFVGRAEELRLLKELYHATGRERRGRLISVIGPAGIGKTRLARELTRYLDGLVEPVFWHAGRSPAYGEGITFWALGEMVRGRAGLVETDDERTTRAKLAALVDRHVPDEVERRWIETALLALLGVEAVARTDELFAAWRTFFERLASSATVVLAFEDHHFADSGLLAFVDHLVEWSRNVPICVITLARPELLDRRPDWGIGQRNFTSMHLEPLTEAAMQELIAGLAPALPDSAVAAIVGRADGIPLYAVEMIRALVADGRLVSDGDQLRASGDLTDIAVPESLTALIASRLDALDAPDRALVSDAAVLGQSFTPAALAAVSGVPETDLEPRLRGLARREVVRLEVDPRSPERGQYAFVQALIREVAYNTLSRRDRKVRHLAAARFFEGLGSDELAGALAGHYLAAQRHAAAGPEAEALAAQARIALRAAADRATALGSHQQAVSFVEQALPIAAEDGERAELLERKAEAEAELQRFDEAEADFRAALAIREAAGERTSIARTTTELARMLIRAFRFETAFALLEPASAALGELRNEPAGIGLDGQLARAAFLTDAHQRAVELSERVLEAAERAELVPIVADTLITKGSALVNLGRRHEGIGLIEAGGRLAEAHGLQGTSARALINLSALLASDEPRTALDAARRGLTLARRLGIRAWQIIDNLADGAIRTGDWDELTAELATAVAEATDPIVRAALLLREIELAANRGAPFSERLEELRTLTAEDGSAVKRSIRLAADAQSALADGRLAEARAGFRAGADAFPSYIVPGHRAAARLAIWLGDPVAALDDLAAIDASGWRGRALDVDRLTIRAGIAALDGRPDEALGFFREALQGWRDLRLPWDEALCAIDMATLLDPAEPEVEATVEAGRTILADLGARPFLERLDAARVRLVARRRPPDAPVTGRQDAGPVPSESR